MTPQMCDEAKRLKALHQLAKGTPQEQEKLNDLIIHRLLHDEDPDCLITTKKALALRDAGKVVIEGRFR